MAIPSPKTGEEAALVVRVRHLTERLQEMRSFDHVQSCRRQRWHEFMAK